MMYWKILKLKKAIMGCTTKIVGEKFETVDLNQRKGWSVFAWEKTTLSIRYKFLFKE